ncbi:MAG: DPP IV N-terminal domain-containing protein [Phycisphaerales bacterium]
MRTLICTVSLGLPLVLAACAVQPRTESAGDGAPKVKNLEFLEQYAATSSFRLGQPKAVTPTPQGDAVLFLRSTGGRSFVQDLWMFDVASKSERVLLTAEQVLAGNAEVLTAEELARRERMRMSSRGIASFDLSDDGNSLLVPLSGRLFVIDIADRAHPKVRELKSEGASGFPIDPRFTPDGTKVVSVRNNNLYVFDLASGKEQRLTTGGTDAVSFGTAEFAAQEEMDRREGYWVSPDGEWIAYQRTDTSKVETFTIADAANPGKAAQSWPYPRAGKANADVSLLVASIDGGRPVTVDWDREEFPYLARVYWEKNAPLTVLVQNRTQTEQRLLRVDPRNGKTRTLLIETDPAWINLAGAAWLKDGSGFLWVTEQDSAGVSDRPRLELRSADGKLESTLIGGDASFGFGGFDQAGKTVVLTKSRDYSANQLWAYPLARDGAPGRWASCGRTRSIPRC